MQRERMSFPELWRDLRADEAKAVRKNIKEGLRRCASTFWRWYTGQKSPELFAERKLFAEIINDTLGIDTDADTLFPNNDRR